MKRKKYKIKHILKKTKKKNKLNLGRICFIDGHFFLFNLDFFCCYIKARALSPTVLFEKKKFEKKINRRLKKFDKKLIIQIKESISYQQPAISCANNNKYFFLFDQLFNIKHLLLSIEVHF